jgi:UDP-N-acetylmuramate--alanine ligase
VPGEHNVRNALAVLALAHRLGLDAQAAAQAMGEFRGTQRRFELRGEAGGVTVIDDYAHHPTEIRTTLAAARLRYPGRRIWAVWQPHTFTRIAALKEQFQHAFADADMVLVTEVYAARAREDNEHFSIAGLVSEMDHTQVRYCPTLDKACAYLHNELRHGDVLLVLSAGDADRISSQILEFLHGKGDKDGKN